MEKRSLLRVISLAVLALFMLKCEKEDLLVESPGDFQPAGELKHAGKNKDHTFRFYGPAVPLGNGIARTWVAQNHYGAPVSIGISLSSKALQGLPDETVSLVLNFPKAARQRFYTHALVDWNPAGHEPDGVYTLPHFDFHFYTIPNSERLAIEADDLAEFASEPNVVYQPPLYLHTPGGVPQMGAHWVDLLAPEFNGGIFTKTFIWGSYDGEFIFWEPMITLEYLLSKPDNSVSGLRQPQAYQRDGWYANSYTVDFSAKFKDYTIALTDLEYHKAQ